MTATTDKPPTDPDGRDVTAPPPPDSAGISAGLRAFGGLLVVVAVFVALSFSFGFVRDKDDPSIAEVAFTVLAVVVANVNMRALRGIAKTGTNTDSGREILLRCPAWIIRKQVLRASHAERIRRERFGCAAMQRSRHQRPPPPSGS